MALDALPTLPGFTPLETRPATARGAIVVDIRGSPEFGAAHIPGAINIQFSHKQFAERVANLISAGTPLLLLGEEDVQVAAAASALLATRLANVSGYLAGGLHAWKKAGLPIGSLASMSIHELRDRLAAADPHLTVLDVREPWEWEELGYIEGAVLIPMGEAESRRRELPRDRMLAIICEHGFRSSTVASILVRHGFVGMANVAEGMAGWRTAGYPLAEGQPEAK